MISSSKNSKAPSIISSHHNGGARTQQYETASQFSRGPRSVTSPKPTAPRPMNAITIPSASNKGSLLGDQEMTEEEIEHLAEVCRRCELLQRQDDERIRNIREKAIAKEKARSGISTFDDEHCAICGANFIQLLNPKSTCMQCERFICRNCIQKRFAGGHLICRSCFSECTNKARTGLWFTEKLQIAKKEGRIIQLAPTSALRASLIRKKREQSSASSMVGKPPEAPQPNGSNADVVQEALRRLTNENDTSSNQRPSIFDSRRRRSSASSAASSAIRPPLPKNVGPTNSQLVADQLAFNLIFSGVDDLPKTLPRTRSRQHSSSGYTTPNATTGGNSSVAFDGNNWESRSMVSAVSVGSVTSVYSEREESFTHGISVTGDLSFSVDYDEKSGCLRVYVKQGRQVAVADPRTGHSDTYVKTYLLPDKTKASKRKTRVKKGTLNPVFNESLIYSIPKADLAYRTLQISLWHYRHMKANLFLGEVLVQLADYRFSSTPIWRALQTRTSLDSQLVHQLTKGKLHIGLKFVPGPTSEQGELHVLLRGATDLNIPIGSQNDSSSSARNTVNAYVKTHLLPDRHRDSKRKTKIIKKTNDPIWDQTIVYTGIPKTHLPSIGVQAIVWDDVPMKHNEYLGGCNLNTGSRAGYGLDASGNERSLWVEMMSKPNAMVEATINLRSTMD